MPKIFPHIYFFFLNCLQKINGLTILKNVNGSAIVQSAHFIVLLIAHLAISSAVVGRRLVGDNRRTVRKSDCTSLSPSLEREGGTKYIKYGCINNKVNIFNILLPRLQL